MVARIKGPATEGALTGAVEGVQQRHTNLRVRLEDDEQHNPWFTSDGVGPIPISVVQRQSADRWSRVVQEACKIPLDFGKRPAIRFILVQSEEVSELVIMCHHILCDGMSLASRSRPSRAPWRPVSRSHGPTGSNTGHSGHHAT